MLRILPEAFDFDPLRKRGIYVYLVLRNSDLRAGVVTARIEQSERLLVGLTILLTSADGSDDAAETAG